MQARELQCRVIFGRGLHAAPGNVDMDDSLHPIHAPDPLRRDHDMLAGQPVAGVDYEITYRPGRVLEEKVRDVPEGIVACQKVIAGHLFRTSQVRTGRCSTALTSTVADRWQCSHRTDRMRRRAPQIGAAPIVGIAVMLVEIALVLSRDRLVGVETPSM